MDAKTKEGLKLIGCSDKEIARRELEERMNAVMRPIVIASELVIWAVLTYAMLFVGCLWASM